MHVKPARQPSIPNAPQLHSSKHHCSYNGRKHLPFTVWIRSPTVRSTQLDGEFSLVYEVILYYQHNRACRIFRTWDDFCRLRSGLPLWKDAPHIESENDVHGLHQFLTEAVAKRADECAMEYFLRRRMEDCH